MVVQSDMAGRPLNPKAPRRTFTWQAHPDDIAEWEAVAELTALPLQTWVKATLTKEARQMLRAAGIQATPRTNKKPKRKR